MSLTQEQKSAIEEFEGDLSVMTEKQMKFELEEVTYRINEDTSWQEALTSKLIQLSQKQTKEG